MREVGQGIRLMAPGIQMRVRFSACDTVPFRPDPALSGNGKLGPGIPESRENLIPYRWGFGVKQSDPTQMDLTETIQFVSLLEELGIHLVNVTAGSPYFNPPIQRPALYPPSGGDQPPEEPLFFVAPPMNVTRELSRGLPNLIFVSTSHTYL